MKNSNPNQGEKILSRGMPSVRGVIRRGIFRGIAGKRRREKVKTKRRILHMSRRMTDPML